MSNAKMKVSMESRGVEGSPDFTIAAEFENYGGDSEAIVHRAGTAAGFSALLNQLGIAIEVEKAGQQGAITKYVSEVTAVSGGDIGTKI